MILNLLLLESCNKKESDNKPITNIGGVNGKKPILALKGKEWLTTCLRMKDQEGVEVLEYKAKIVFKNETQFSSYTTQFRQNVFSGCVDEHKDFTFEYSGTYKISNGEILFDVTNIYETPLSENALNINLGLYNIPDYPLDLSEEGDEPISVLPVPYCGISDWAIDVRKEITGLTCWEEVNEPFTTSFKFQAYDEFITLDEDRYDLVK